jgi:hypothetical protein
VGLAGGHSPVAVHVPLVQQQVAAELGSAVVTAAPENSALGGEM